MPNAKEAIFHIVKGAFHGLGLQIAFDRPVRSIAKLASLKMAELGVQTLLDVGANIGQFVAELRLAGYKGAVVSFEPLTAAYEHLRENAARDANWTVAPRMALGDAPGSTKINVSTNLVSSSLLHVAERSIRAAPESGFTGTEEVDIHCLDDSIVETWRRPFALKLDTQGYELHVLRGAPKALASTVLVVAELSLDRLYVGGASFVDVYRHLEESGFRCISLVQGFADHRQHELLQVDSIFVRRIP